jgi:NAD+ diphosphatase
VNAARFDVSDHPELGPHPHLGYTASLIDRAADRRTDDALLAKFEKDSRAGAYVIGGEMVVMRQQGDGADPLFSVADANGLGAAREKIFLGLMDEAPRFGFGLDAAAIEPLKSRNDLKITDLRSIAVQGLVDAKHLPPLAEAKAMIGWHAKHRFCPNCGTPTRTVHGRLAARLSVLSCRAFPPDRSGGDYACDCRRTLRSWPVAPLRCHHVVLPGRIL